MKKIIFIILFIASCNLILFAQSEISQEEYNLYSKILDKGAVIDRKTFPIEIEERLIKSLSKLPKDLVNDFLQKNNRSFVIENKSKDFKFSDQDDPTWNTYNKDKNEIHFVLQKRQYISRVGFSKNKTQALVAKSIGTDGLPYGATWIVWYVRKIMNGRKRNRF